MKDFFIVAHKYATNIVVDTMPDLSTKSWHLNDAIKKVIMSMQQPSSEYHVEGDTLYAMTDDDVVSALLRINSGLGNVNSDTLDLDNE